MSGSEHTEEVSDGRVLTVRLCVRLTPQEKERLEGEARLAQLTLSRLVRRRLVGIRIEARADIVMVNELRRIGGLLKKVHNESGGAYSQATAEALQLLGEYLRTLAQ